MESSHCASVEVDEWDADGFEIPSLKLANCDSVKDDAVATKSSISSSQKMLNTNEKIYLGPHLAPPSQVKQHEPKTGGKKQGYKHKPTEGEKRGLPWVTRMK
ncbi:hypothetical protein SUGI_0298790 [Cryptomeria japonica]|uniref:uncharacterized protein LOC131064326 n=1 Tax=Cryptomeria japonica TaxID=3369 RepID=UPI002408D7A3|nr:uncharacterized protein LOC131064326 [Cryptomeria japonica]GLJ17237.1 hypothetical protein SUGI_0298790 [Cryptomeria japonica]